MKTKQLQTEWREVELGDEEYFEILSSGINKFEGEKDYLSTESIKLTKIEKVECKITYGDRPSRANMQPVLNSIWFAKMQATLKVYCFDEENKEEIEKYILSTGFAGIKVQEDKIYPRYLKIILASNFFNEEKNRLCTGSTQRGINNNFIAKIKIPLPPLKTQKAIVSILEKSEQLKEKRKQTIEFLDDYLKSVFKEMFKQERKKFEIKGFLDVFNITTGKLDSNAMEDGGKYPFFTCSQETFRINKCAFDCEALLLSGNNAAGVYSVKYYKGKFNAYQRTYVLTLKEESDFRYLYFVLTNKLEELKGASIGTNTKYLTLGILRNIKIPLPPIELQQKFASIVEHVEKLKEKQKQSLEEIKKLSGALTQKAFRGDLV